MTNKEKNQTWILFFLTIAIVISFIVILLARQRKINIYNEAIENMKEECL